MLFHTEVTKTLLAVDGSVGRPIHVGVKVEFQGTVMPVLGVGRGTPDKKLLESPVDEIKVVLTVGNGTATVEVLVVEVKGPVCDRNVEDASVTDPIVPLGQTVELTGKGGTAVALMLVAVDCPVPETTIGDVCEVGVVIADVKFPIELVVETGVLELVGTITGMITVVEVAFHVDHCRVRVPVALGGSVIVSTWVVTKIVPLCETLTVELGNGNGTSVSETEEDGPDVLIEAVLFHPEVMGRV